MRRAINYAINRKALIKTAYAGYGKLIGTHSSPADPWYLDLSNTYPYDPAKAKKLLAQAGYAKGFSLTMQLPPVNYAQQSGAFIQSELGQVGIKVKIQNVDFPLWINRVFASANYDLTIIAHVEARDLIKYADPKYYWRYDNKTVQKLIAAGGRRADGRAVDRRLPQGRAHHHDRRGQRLAVPAAEPRGRAQGHHRVPDQRALPVVRRHRPPP